MLSSSPSWATKPSYYLSDFQTLTQIIDFIFTANYPQKYPEKLQKNILYIVIH
jgi:hypothetical protein